MQMTYCKAGETPGNQNIMVIDLDTGKEVGDVCEIDTKAGWLDRYKRVGSGFEAIDGVATVVRMTGRFEIRPIPRVRA